MLGSYSPLEVRVWGAAACFTRPEMKAERVSYPVPTPSAARGILEAIFWKPEFAWQVREVWLLRPIRFLSMVRNEVSAKASVGRRLIAEDHRAQRHTLALSDVAYLLKADVVPHGDDDPAKYRDQFRRRVERGQCYHRPYLGCREFAADFGPRLPDDRPIERSEDLGLMLFDLTYEHDAAGRGVGAAPHFFQARLDNGVVTIPPELYRSMEVT